MNRFDEVARCFHPEDAYILKGILRYITEDFENSEHSNAMVMFLLEGDDRTTDMVKTLLRMLKAAEIMYGKDKCGLQRMETVI